MVNLAVRLIYYWLLIRRGGVLWFEELLSFDPRRRLHSFDSFDFRLLDSFDFLSLDSLDSLDFGFLLRPLSLECFIADRTCLKSGWIWNNYQVQLIVWYLTVLWNLQIANPYQAFVAKLGILKLNPHRSQIRNRKVGKAKEEFSCWFFKVKKHIKSLCLWWVHIHKQRCEDWRWRVWVACNA